LVQRLNEMARRYFSCHLLICFHLLLFVLELKEVNYKVKNSQFTAILV
jgi:hypothetical protein